MKPIKLRIPNMYFINYTEGKCKYYLYRHIRIDKDIPFYIGIGTNDKRKYCRSKMIQNRSNHWLSIINKTEIIVEIIFESDNKEEILNKEQEFIKLYGRLDNKTGILTNYTDGGDGQNGRKQSIETINKRVLKTSKVVYQYDINGNFIKEWKSVTFVSKCLMIDKKRISACATNVLHTYFGFRWSYIKLDKLEPIQRDNSHITEEYLNKLSIAKLGKKPKNFEAFQAKRHKKVLEFENGILVKTYNSSFEADRELGLNSKTISNYLTRNSKYIKKYRNKSWKYE
jgi:hypothetical protein